MPGIEVNGVRWPSVSTEVFGKRDREDTEVTLVIVRDGCVQLCEHDLLVEYARECLMEDGMALADYAEQVMVPHPVSGRYVQAGFALDHDGNTSKVIAFANGVRLYEWPI